MQTVALIDYGSGNLPSADKALRKAAASLQTPMTVVTTDDPQVIARADRVVLPGVGAFASCMSALQARPGVIDAMDEAITRRGAPFLGICVGMQLLATRGLEFGETAGLGWVEGDVKRMETPDTTLKIPHMGWNGLDTVRNTPLFAGLNSGVHMYFTHSYVLVPERVTDVAAWTDHGGAFAAAVVRGNIAGVQFHPEKSQGAGAKLLGNFLNWRP
jgi:glutamine amidotransferase